MCSLTVFKGPWSIPALLLAAIIFTSCTKSPKVEKEISPAKPNIILIMVDDLGMETIGTYGGQSYQTPNLDMLAATGMQFQNCYATPLCTPSRVQIMTGKYNFRNYFAFGMLDANERTFGHALQDAGYSTCIAGKWQLYGNQRQQELADGRTGTLPQAAGFDSYRLWQVKDRGWRYKTPTLETFSEGLTTYDQEYGPDKFVEFIESFVSEPREQPFFVYFPMCLVHDPFLPSPDHSDFDAYDPKLNTNDTTYFESMMTYMDSIVGRLVKKVDELGIRENTLIIFTGDNGTDRKVVSTWNGQRIAGMKGYTVEAGTHVPLIVNWPGTIASGQENQNLIDFTDFYPTLMEIAGADEKELDGQSFYHLLLGENGPTRDWIFCHYDPRWGKFQQARYVQNTEWKLYGNGEFYNFLEDPNEEHPVPDEQLTSAQLEMKISFQQVLDQMSI